LDIPTEMVRRWSREYSASGNLSFEGNEKPVLSPEQQRSTTEEIAERCPDRAGYPKKGRKHLLQKRQQLFRFMIEQQREFAIEKM
jgi:hypothetical protein